jgi:hypothetical protein
MPSSCRTFIRTWLDNSLSSLQLRALSDNLQVPPPFVQIPQVHLFWNVQIRCHITLHIKLFLRKAIAPIREPVLGATVRVVIILPTRFSFDINHMSCTARPEPVNSCTRTASVGPTAAFSREIHSRIESIAVLQKVVRGGLLRHDTGYSLRAHFSQDFGYISCLCFDSVRHCS